MDLVERLLFPEIKRRLQKPYTVAEEGVGNVGAFLRIGTCVAITHDAAGEEFEREMVAQMSERDRAQYALVHPGPHAALLTVRVGDDWYGREVSFTVDAKTEPEWLAKAVDEIAETLEGLIEDFGQPVDEDSPEADDERSLAMIDGVRREYAKPLFG